jgi:hypothetical protein
MLNGLIQQFAGGGANGLEGEALHGGVAQMLGSAPNEHGTGAIGEALGALGGMGFGQSVSQGAGNASPEARSGIAGMLMGAISQGGGSPDNVLSSLGIGGSGKSMGPSELGTLASYTAEHHPNELASVMGSQLGSSGGSGGSELLHVLGNPMVRQVGMSLAKRLL